MKGQINLSKSKIYQLSEKEFIEIVKSSKSYNECLKKIGLSHGRSQNDLLKKRCSELEISTEHFTFSNTPSNKKYTLEEIFKENSEYTNMTRMKTKILDNKMLIYECAICGNKGEWQGKPLTLQLDHKNGNHKDNRIENLRFLCPNCHTQTETYGSKSRAKS